MTSTNVKYRYETQTRICNLDMWYGYMMQMAAWIYNVNMQHEYTI